MHKLFFVFSIGLAIHAQTIHVNPYGPANGDGSSGAPFNNIAAAVARANTIGGIPTILIDPGYYPISDTIKIEAPMTLQGSEVLQVDPQGWPTGVVLSGERRLVGTSNVANKTMISVAKSGSVLYNVAIGGISFEGVAGTGSILDMARVQNASIRGNIFKGTLSNPGINFLASSGEIRDNYMFQLLAGAFVSGGYTASPANVIYSSNRSVHGRVGLFLVGTSEGITDPGDHLNIVVQHNDLSNNTAGNSVGLRITIKGNEALGTAGLSAGYIQAAISSNNLTGNTTGISIDGGFVTRLKPDGTCDERTFSGTMSLSFSGNTLSSTVRNSVVSLTQLQATLSQNFSAAQYLHHATFLIADSDHLFQNLTTIDHPVKDRYVGPPCPMDMTAEVLNNTLVINTLIPAKN